MTIRIDRGVPPPEAAPETQKYPWGEMKPGDSFFVPGRKASAMSTAAIQWAKRNNARAIFRAKTRTEDGVEGCRVWRIR